jgi:hypothetical protein
MKGDTMIRSDLIQCLIFVLVVSLVIVGAHAGETIDVLHDDTTSNVDKPYVSVSGDEIHVPGHTCTFDGENPIDTIPLHTYE